MEMAGSDLEVDMADCFHLGQFFAVWQADGRTGRDFGEEKGERKGVDRTCAECGRMRPYAPVAVARAIAR